MSAWHVRLIGASLACLVLASCATPPNVVIITAEEESAPEQVHIPSPLIEYPPIEPVEPPVTAAIEPAPTPPPLAAAAPAGAAPGATSPPAQGVVSAAAPAASAPATPASASPPDIVASIPPTLSSPARPAPAPAPAPEDLELLALLSDLQRYGNLGADDVRRELNNATNALARQRSDANRVRLAVLYTVSRANPQDDQRAVLLLDNVIKGPGANPGVRELAVVLQIQVMGRQKAVRDEQQKADIAIQKLEALRQMERSLIRDRVRSGGGGSGSGGGSGGGGGGSGGGG